MEMYDIYIAYVSWGEDGKYRPVLVLYETSDCAVVFSITTQYESKSDVIRSKYYKIMDWQWAGLDAESYIDTNKTATLPLSAFAHFAGRLTEFDVMRLLAFVARQ